MALEPTPPVRDALVDTQRLITPPWQVWFRDQREAIDATATVLERVALTEENASISTTPIPTDSLAAGVYAVQWYQAVEVAAGVSSSLTLTVTWTDGGVSKTRSSAAMTGNTTATSDGDTWVVHLDSGTPVSYATTYLSNAAGAMEYRLDLVLSLVSADA